MNIPKIEVLRDHDGDWTIMRINDKNIYEGHSFREDILLDWLEQNRIINYHSYSLEDGEITVNDDEVEYDDCEKWVQDAYDDHKDNLEGW